MPEAGPESFLLFSVVPQGRLVPLQRGAHWGLSGLAPANLSLCLSVFSPGLLPWRLLWLPPLGLPALILRCPCRYWSPVLTPDEPISSICPLDTVDNGEGQWIIFVITALYVSGLEYSRPI